MEICESYGVSNDSGATARRLARLKRGETLEQLGIIGADIVIAVHMVPRTIKRNSSSGAIGSVGETGF